MQRIKLIALAAALASTYAEAQVLTDTGASNTSVHASNYAAFGDGPETFEVLGDNHSHNGGPNVYASASSGPDTVYNFTEVGAMVVLASSASDANTFVNGATTALYSAYLAEQSSASSSFEPQGEFKIESTAEVQDELDFTLSQTTELTLTGAGSQTDEGQIALDLFHIGSVPLLISDLSGSFSYTFLLSAGEYALLGNVYSVDGEEQGQPFGSDGHVLGSDSASLNYTATFTRPAPPAVPEPITTFLGVGGIGLAVRRRARRSRG